MNKKLIFIFSMACLTLVCIGAVSANELNGTDNGDFDYLENQINITDENQILNLQKDYHFTNASHDYIVIDKSITIDGNDYEIDAPDVSRVFWVKADNVTIKNINFVNAKKAALAGGVISWWGNNGTLINCNFSDNLAASAGGAVLWRGDNGIISNCNFWNNTVKTAADVSLTDGDGYDPSQPHIQTVDSHGGALYLCGNNISVDNCNFIDNYAEFSGGAIRILWKNNITVSNSKFKNNKAQHSGGAISWYGDEVLIWGCKFIDNSPKDLFFFSENITVKDSYFKNENCIDSYYGANFTNVRFGCLTFEDLNSLINNTPEGGILVLDVDYEYVNGSNKGILISKPITIDGVGHTLNGNKLSRMFNVTSDNVTIKNINFINGNAYGKYFTNDVGGGAIYWNGANGLVENCSFTNNRGSGIEDDPFDKEEISVDENGTVWHVIRIRPDGAKTNEGGAIVWNGTNGTVSKCIFKSNGVGYPNPGGAICWRGDFGNVFKSEFYDNDGWSGAAVSWMGSNGTVSHSKFFNTGSIFGRDIMWFGNNGTIKYSVLFGYDGGSQVYPYSGSLVADYNFWGDFIDNPNEAAKIDNLKNWIVLNATYDKSFIDKGDIISVNISTLLYEKGGKLSKISGFDIADNFTAEADAYGFVKLVFEDGKLTVKIIPKTKIVSSDFTKYYKQSKQFKVRVYGADGKLAIGKTVKFTINKHTYEFKTDENGYISLYVNLKPGKYTLTIQYENVTVKNKITVKTTLITKNVSKKVKKTGKFTVKVLNSKGKALAKKVVKIKFKGKTYKIKTNKNGIATLKLSKNLKIGKYTIKTTFNGLTNTNKIIVKK